MTVLQKHQYIVSKGTNNMLVSNTFNEKKLVSILVILCLFQLWVTTQIIWVTIKSYMKM